MPHLSPHLSLCPISLSTGTFINSNAYQTNNSICTDIIGDIPADIFKNQTCFLRPKKSPTHFCRPSPPRKMVTAPFTLISLGIYLQISSKIKLASSVPKKSPSHFCRPSPPRKMVTAPFTLISLGISLQISSKIKLASSVPQKKSHSFLSPISSQENGHSSIYTDIIGDIPADIFKNQT